MTVIDMIINILWSCTKSLAYSYFPPWYDRSEYSDSEYTATLAYVDLLSEIQVVMILHSDGLALPDNPPSLNTYYYSGPNPSAYWYMDGPTNSIHFGVYGSRL